MAVSKVLMLSILLAMVISGIRSEDEVTAIHVDDVVGVEEWDSALKLEIEQLKSKISSLGEFWYRLVCFFFLFRGICI